MQEIKICRIENRIHQGELDKNVPQIFVGSPCDELQNLQKDGFCVLAELAHLQGLTEDEIAEALCKEEAVLQYENVCICAEELSQAYLRRIWCKNKKLPVIIVETERLIIRESVEEDAEAFCELYRDAECRKYLELPPADDVQTYRQYIKDYQNGQYAFYEYGMWTLVEKESGAVVGRAGLEQQTFAKDQIGVGLGYAILPQHRGKGYAEEACQAILAYSKECEYAEKIYVKIDKENNASMTVYHKLGNSVELIVVG